MCREICPEPKVLKGHAITFDIVAFLGIVKILNSAHILVVREASLVGMIDDAEIYKIEAVEVEPLQQREVDPTHTYVSNLKKLMTSGFYFAFHYDLTCSRQRNWAKTLRADLCDKPISETAEERYFWNKAIYDDVHIQGVDSRWLVPIIQGYIWIKEYHVEGNRLTYVLISRRSCQRVGTRFIVRGVDDKGQVGNFVETEQMVKVKSTWFSHCQIRGSAPIFWQQKGISQQVSITREKDLGTPAFAKHLEDLSAHYGEGIFINLLSKSKQNEKALTAALEDQFRILNPKNFKYRFFDFHSQVKSQHYETINSTLINDLRKTLANFGYYVEEYGQQPNITQIQDGVIRTNCLDCLDRTNVVQSRVAIQVLKFQLKSVGINNLAIIGEDVSGTPYVGSVHPFIDNVKNIWAENGDALSRQYAGTGSTTANVTRTGKQGFLGILHHGIKAINRFYVNNFEDSQKQECIDILLNKHSKTTSVGISAKVKEKLKAREKDFCRKKNAVVQLVTWNCAGNAPPQNLNLDSLVLLNQQRYPDIYIFGFQELVDLNAKNVIKGTNADDVALWNRIIETSLKKTGKEYTKIQSKNMVGCMITMFVKSKLKSHVHNIEVDRIKTGFGGNVGNKGAVCIRFDIYDTSICAINAHLESGKSKVEIRNNQFIEIFKKAFVKESSNGKFDYSVEDHDIAFFFGDLNYRISLSYDECLAYIKLGKLDQLLRNDQLNCLRNKIVHLNTFQEGQITFNPTYKYDPNSDVYDTSKKLRVPSWTDRILFRGQEIELDYYNRQEFQLSDHRPVCGIYRVQIKQYDDLKRNEILKEIHEELKLEGEGDEQEFPDTRFTRNSSGVLAKKEGDDDFLILTQGEEPVVFPDSDSASSKSNSGVAELHDDLALLSLTGNDSKTTTTTTSKYSRNPTPDLLDFGSPQEEVKTNQMANPFQEKTQTSSGNLLDFDDVQTDKKPQELWNILDEKAFQSSPTRSRNYTVSRKTDTLGNPFDQNVATRVRSASMVDNPFTKKDSEATSTATTTKLIKQTSNNIVPDNGRVKQNWLDNLNPTATNTRTGKTAITLNNGQNQLNRVAATSAAIKPNHKDESKNSLQWGNPFLDSKSSSSTSSSSAASRTRNSEGNVLVGTNDGKSEDLRNSNPFA